MDILHRNLIVSCEEITLNDRVISNLSPIERRKILGKDISLIMQNPLTALDPTVKVGKQILETLKIHNPKMSKKHLINIVNKLLDEVYLDLDIYNKFPHEISGGMAQKVVIAIAIANSPKLIIADEPITALDKKNTYDILNLLKEKQHKQKSMMVYISHDIESVEFMADKILVLYKGTILEILSKSDFKKPLHPYTIDLKTSVITGTYSENKIQTVSKTANLDTGCIYYNYCTKRTEECKNDVPLKKINNNYVRCINVKE